MSERLAEKTAVITGGAGGIGLATARLFLAEGARVALVDRDRAALDAASAALPETLRPRCTVTLCDIADDAATAQAMSDLAAAFGRLDILVNNAAAREYHPLAAAAAESWTRIIAVNLVGTSNVTRACLPFLRRAGRGAIVNVSSVFALVGRAGMGQYDATKAAILAMTRVLANEEAAHGVRVNAVCPGSVLTPFTRGRAAARGLSEAELRATGHVKCPLDRWGRPEEIAYPILWLASDEASFITGAVLAVDGGLTAR